MKFALPSLSISHLLGTKRFAALGALLLTVLAISAVYAATSGPWTTGSSSTSTAGPTGNATTISFSTATSTTYTAATLNSTDFWTNPYGGSVAGAPSVSTFVPWNTSALVTVTFSRPTDNPVLHIDKLGGTVSCTSGSTRGCVYSSVWTLESFTSTSSTVTAERLGGNDIFVVNGQSFQRGNIGDEITTSATNAECTGTEPNVTACGSVRYAGTGITTLRFRVSWVKGATMPVVSGMGETLEFTWSVPDPADLSITKTDGVANVNAGASSAYTVVVTNNGPTAVTGAILRDAVATNLTKTSIACAATPGTCTAGSRPTIAQIESAGGYALPTIPSGGTYRLVVNATVAAAATGTVANTATITAPSNIQDHVLTNNSATDTNNINALYGIRFKKDWVGAIPNNAVTLAIAGGSNAVGGSSVAGAPTQTDATARAASGATITLSEAFTAGSAASYTPSFSCVRDSGGAVTTANGVFTMPAGDVTCTVTNSRTLPTGTLPPTWTGAKTCPAANPLSANSALQVGWNHNWPDSTPNPDQGSRVDFPTADPVAGGPGITYTPTNTAGVARLVDTQSAAAAFAAGDYVSYHVRTGASTGNRTLQSIRWGINNENQWVNGYPYKFAVLISNSSSFATAQVLIMDEQSPFTTAGPYQEYTRAVPAASRIILQPNTDYYFRVLLYATDAKPTDYDTAIWDDFAINTADCETQPVQLAKTWTGATAGHQASATTTGAINSNATFTSTAPTATTGTAVKFFKGETITLPAETFAGGATAAMYNSTVSCTGGSTLASGAVGRTLTIANSDTATVCTYSNVFTGPLTLVKTSLPYWDPSNLFTNPKMIPGAYVNYTLAVGSPAITVTSNSVIVTDALPPQVNLCVAAVGQCSAPVTWNVGTSGLTYTYGGLSSGTDDVSFSTDGVNWGYTPIAGADGTDPAVRHIRVNPKGSMNPSSNFNIVLRTVLK